jgi:hypothetical protein
LRKAWVFGGEVLRTQVKQAHFSVVCSHAPAHLSRLFKNRDFPSCLRHRSGKGQSGDTRTNHGDFARVRLFHGGGLSVSGRIDGFYCTPHLGLVTLYENRSGDMHHDKVRTCVPIF